MQIKTSDFKISAQAAKDYPKDGLPQIAVAGRSNVGKSSLLNFLLQRKNLVKTSQMPGKTKLINFFLINNAFYFVDIPGFGYAQTGREDKRSMEDAIEDYFKGSGPQGTGALAGLLYLVDIRMTDSAVDGEALKWLTDFEIPMLVVATKGDKLGKEKARKALKDIAENHGLPQPPLLTSSDAKTGREEVLEQIGILLEAAKPAG